MTKELKAGANVLGLHIGEGWYGMWGYGNPTAKAVLRYTAGGMTTTVAPREKQVTSRDMPTRWAIGVMIM